MPQVDVDGLTINYDVQGEGEPLLLIPYLSADHACYAFQLPAYADHFTASLSTFLGRGRATSPPGRTRPKSTRTRSPASSARSGLSRHISQASRLAPQ